MRRKILAAALLLALLAQLAPASMAEETVYFTAVNETVLELSDATMPFWSGGYLYVPATIFSGKELDVYYSSNAARQTVILYDRSSSLIFDLDGRTMTDSQGNTFTQKPIERGGMVFVPVSTVTNFFRLTYTSTKVTLYTGGQTIHGYLVRVKNSGAVLSDRIFTDAAASQLIYRFNGYYSGKNASPSAPGGEEPVPPPSPIEEVRGKRLYLCFAVRDAAATEGLLDLLDRYGAKAAFYFPVDALADSGDLLRRMAGSGQSIGLLTAADAGGGWQEALPRANRALSRATGEKTRLTLLAGAGAETLTAAADQGWRCLTPTLDQAENGLSTASGVSALLKKAEAQKADSVTVWLDGNITEEALRMLLTAAAAAGDRCLALTETVE